MSPSLGSLPSLPCRLAPPPAHPPPRLTGRPQWWRCAHTAAPTTGGRTSPPARARFALFPGCAGVGSPPMGGHADPWADDKPTSSSSHAPSGAAPAPAARPGGGRGPAPGMGLGSSRNMTMADMERERLEFRAMAEANKHKPVSRALGWGGRSAERIRQRGGVEWDVAVGERSQTWRADCTRCTARAAAAEPRRVRQSPLLHPSRRRCARRGLCVTSPWLLAVRVLSARARSSSRATATPLS